ncbi:MAG TPA: bifunctional glutamate N-acetyltransferase/amino-acid acetyltransferase ArgJ [Dehalococcoidia bacterium]
MGDGFKAIVGGTLTSPQGFLAGAVEASIKNPDKLDLAVLYSEKLCVAAGVFTTNLVKSAPVLLSKKHLKNGKAQAIVVNSGCANACTGNGGMDDATEMADLTSAKLGLSTKDVIVASTGVIGVRLPMSKIRTGVSRIVPDKDGGHALAQAIMTTDTFPKEIAIAVESKTGRFTIGGAAKGAGMIHPDMATLLSFLTTDAVVEPRFLKSALKKSANNSFNLVTIDGDTSPSDTMVILANGMAGTKTINKTNGQVFQKALDEVCLFLAKCIARDGEGATKSIEVVVEGAASESQARVAARTIAGSTLFKAAMFGNDPNWGRIVAALGRSGARVDEKRLEVYLNGVCVMRRGGPVHFDEPKMRDSLAGKEVKVRVCLNLGSGKATAWGCDLSDEYVTINSAYTS